ncbi:MAG: nuclease-related domain-containing protein [Pseudomonadota bacterium]
MLLPLMITLVVIVIPGVALHFWIAHRERTKRSPHVSQLLRGPGESLRKEMENTFFDIATFLSITPLMALLVFAIHVSTSYFGGRPESPSRLFISVSLALCVLGFGYYKLSTLVRKRAKLRQGYEGEVAVAQELNQLMRHGAAIFHDVPGDGFNIDHVLVGKNGIYAIETKSRMKSMRDKGKDAAKVVFDGKCLVFPTWKETQPLEQAAIQAKWLSKWLSSAVGEPVEVRPAVALPGWYVEQIGRSSVHVFNPKMANFLAKGWLREPLSSVLLTRIEHQLDQRCRNVEPTLFGKQKLTL